MNYSYTIQSKMADLLLESHKNILIANRLGIGLGFGDKSILEVCTKNEVDSSLLLLLIRIFSNDRYLPTSDEINNIPIAQTLTFLERSHLHYQEVLIPEINNALSKLNLVCDEVHAKALNRFMNEYVNEVKQHLEYEDKIVYPYVRQLIEGKAQHSFDIQEFEDNHESLDSKLIDLKNILIKYIPEGKTDQLKIYLLQKLSELEKELSRHTLIEDKVLVPCVLSFENKKK